MKRSLVGCLLAATMLIASPLTAVANSTQEAAKATAAVGEMLNINSASAEEIARILKGVGAKKAAAIVEYRKLHGPFKSLEDLKEVKGLGNKLLAANADKIRFK
ncbi:helix-hairpin-helix domain-containing protein [Gallaecimonas sp. GXIMD4217]|uniref:ComEA family DNA-binding protein n=1 Tax=Gallaecimonas sp. GXIMD4217 TaxID=3131927 RepID=UPI00311AC5BE